MFQCILNIARKKMHTGGIQPPPPLIPIISNTRRNSPCLAPLATVCVCVLYIIDAFLKVLSITQNKNHNGHALSRLFLEILHEKCFISYEIRPLAISKYIFFASSNLLSKTEFIALKKLQGK